LAVAHKKLAVIYSRIAGTTLAQVQIRGVHHRQPRDPKAPKKPLTSYLLFCAKVRDEFRKSNPGITSKELASILGHAWRTLDDTSRRRYIAEAKTLKLKYDHDVARFKSSKSRQGSDDLVDSDEDEVEDDVDEDDDDDEIEFNTAAKSKPKSKAANPAANPHASAKLAAVVAAGSGGPKKTTAGKAGSATSDERPSTQETPAVASPMTSPVKKKHRKHKSDGHANGADGAPTKKKAKKARPAI
ncbi:high mobility group box 3, partial [Coemansia asiatica]